MGARRIESGRYQYKGYILYNHGYYEPDQTTWWEAVNEATGCADYHAHTKKELMDLIDEDEEGSDKK